ILERFLQVNTSAPTVLFRAQQPSNIQKVLMGFSHWVWPVSGISIPSRTALHLPTQLSPLSLRRTFLCPSWEPERDKKKKEQIHLASRRISTCTYRVTLGCSTCSLPPWTRLSNQFPVGAVRLFCFRTQPPVFTTSL